jgi:hypothetical protein
LKGLLRNPSSHTRNQVQDALKAFLPRSSSIEARLHAESLPQPLTTIPSPSPPPIAKGFPSKYKCPCGFEPSGKEVYKHANFKRHQETTKCRRFSPYGRPERIKPYQCHYPDCGKSYSRSDNLRAHQRTKVHSLVWQLAEGGSFPQQSEPVAVRDMLEHHPYQGS